MKERNLAREFCVVAGEFSDLRCLIEHPALTDEQEQFIQSKDYIL